MSFILDALRKSEHERERSALPGIGDTPVVRAAPSKMPFMLAGLGLLLGINLIVLLVFLMRGSAHDGAAGSAGGATPASAPAVAAAPAGVATAPIAAPASPASPASSAMIPGAQPLPPLGRELRPLVEEASAPADEAAADTDSPPADEDPGASAAFVQQPRTRPRDPTLDVPPTPASRSAPAVSPVVQPAPSAPQPVSPRTGGVPSINDLSPQATAGLPALNIDLHVYAAEPAQRFVVLNGRRYREGMQLQEGPLLERITPDGVVLNHRGLRFLLPRE